MKLYNVLRRAIMALGATQVLSVDIPRKDTFELRVKRNESAVDNHNYTKYYQNNYKNNNYTNFENLTGFPPGALEETGPTRPTEMFNFATANTAKLGWPEHQVIPVSHSSCTDWSLSVAEMKLSVQKMIEWSLHGGKVESKYLHTETEGKVGIYLCNCKWSYQDTAPASEMWEFYDRLEENCGPGQSGWIFSKEWEKGWAIAARSYVDNMQPKENLCPPYCCGM